MNKKNESLNRNVRPVFAELLEHFSCDSMCPSGDLFVMSKETLDYLTMLPLMIRTVLSECMRGDWIQPRP